MGLEATIILAIVLVVVLIQDKNCCVQHLNLCYNDFGSAGAITLSEALQVGMCSIPSLLK